MLKHGTVIAGKYFLDEMIGQGGFGTIWRANQMDLDRDVAIKFVHGFSVESEVVRERMLAEARAAAAVRQRNVVSILEVGSGEDGNPFLVMEYLEGETLGDRLARKPMRIDDIVRTLEGSLRGLAAVHAAGIVHADVKPENIFLVYDMDGWFAKLLDFGISKTEQANRSTGRSKVVAGSMVTGTPEYMSPEQACGLPVDFRSDLFSIGTIAYEALTGRLPFDGKDPAEVLIAISRRDPRPISELRPDLPPSWSGFIDKALAKQPQKRFRDAREMRLALQAAHERASGGAAQGRKRHGSVSRATRQRPVSTPPPARLPAAPALPNLGPATKAESDPPLRGETAVVPRGRRRPSPRALVFISALAAASLVLAAVGLRYALRDPPPSSPPVGGPPNAQRPVQDPEPSPLASSAPVRPQGVDPAEPRDPEPAEAQDPEPAPRSAGPEVSPAEGPSTERPSPPTVGRGRGTRGSTSHGGRRGRRRRMFTDPDF